MLAIDWRAVNLLSYKDCTITINDGVTAIVGGNGSGKTALIEVIHFVLFGTFPSRPGLPKVSDWLEGKGEARGEYHFEMDGHDYRAIRTIYQAENGDHTTEALLYMDAPFPIPDDEQPVAGPKVRDFERYITNMLGSSKMILASAFSSQRKAGDIVDADPADRTDLMMKFFGCEHFQMTSDMAKKRADSLEDKIAAAVAEAEQIMAVLQKDPIELQERLDKATAEASDLKIGHDLAVEKQLQATEQAATIKAQMSALVLQASEKDGLTAQKSELDKEIKAVNKDILKCETAADELVEVKKQATNQEGLKSQSETMQVKAEKYNLLNSDVLKKKNEVAKLKADWLLRRNEIKDKHAKTERDYQLALQDLQSQKRMLMASLTTAAKASELMGQVPCGGAGKYVACQLLKSSIDSAKSIPAIEQSIVEIDKKIAAKVLEAPEMPGDDPQLAELSTAGQVKAAELTILETALKSIDYDAVEHTQIRMQIQRMADLSLRLARLQAETEKLPSIKENYDRLMMKISVLDKKMNQVEERDQARQQQISNMRVEHNRISEEGSRQATQAESFRARRRENDRLQGELTEALKEMVRWGARLIELETETETMKKKSRVFRVLEKAFGRGGIQALVITNTIPALQQLVNDQLTVFEDQNFKIRFDTQKENKNGSLRDQFMIFINRNGKDKDIASFSPGQQSMAKMIIRMSLAVYASKSLRGHCETFVADESSDDLTVENGKIVITALRAMGAYFRRVICISHHEHILNEIPDKFLVTMTGGVSEANRI